ncbi:MAG: hypothetical protein U1F77_02285 [Kiritimatiellia bacterium]
MKTIDDITKAVRGQLCWGVTWGSQLNMSMSFGDPRLRIIREPHTTKSKSPRLRELARYRTIKVSGRWWLWIFCAHWTLRVSDQLTVTDSSSGKKMMMAMARLDGQRLVGLRVSAETGETEFIFDLGAKLTAWRYEFDDSDIWTLYYPNGFVLGVKGNGTYTYELGDKPADEEHPKKIKTPNHTTDRIAHPRRVRKRSR